MASFVGRSSQSSISKEGRPQAATANAVEGVLALGPSLTLVPSRALGYELRTADVVRLRLFSEIRGPLQFALPDAQATEWALSRHAYLRWRGEELVLASPLAPVRVQLVDPVLTDLLTTFRPERFQNLDDATREWVEPTLALLGQFGLLVDPSAPEQAPAWGFSDLLMHASSAHTRVVDSDDRSAGEAPAATHHPHPFESWIELPAFDRERSEGDPTFVNVLEQRRSIRNYDDDRPLRLEELAELLGRAARVRHTVQAGERSAPYEFTDRPYPGAGGLYPLEIYGVVRVCAGLDAGVYHYDPARHRLDRVNDTRLAPAEALAVAAAGMGGGPEPQVLLVITARPARISWKYGASAFALLLKEVGALMQTLYLVSTWMGLAPCALGSGDGLLFPGVQEPNCDPGEVSVGAFCLGSRPRLDDVRPALVP